MKRKNKVLRTNCCEKIACFNINVVNLSDKFTKWGQKMFIGPDYSFVIPRISLYADSIMAGTNKKKIKE